MSVDPIEAAAAGGDPAAMFDLAHRRMLGQGGPRDLKAAHRLLERAAGKGHAGAARVRATLIGNGTGCRADPDAATRMLRKIAKRDEYAAQQLAFAERMRPPSIGASLPAETLSEAPLVRVVRGFLTADECRYLTALSEPQLRPSVVEDPATGRRFPDPVRTSQGMSFGPLLEDLVVHRINRRLAAATATKVGWGEPLHVLRYAPGEEYKPHFDFLHGVPNQRGWTVLLYLNDGYRGGETRFDAVGIDFRGTAGDALVFRNLDEAGRPDPATRHAGLPVESGTKWLATRWIRQEPYHPWA